MFKMIAKNIEVNMFVGIHDFEYRKKQKILVNVIAYGRPKFQPNNISECIDYSRICDFVHGWTNREHVELIETLLHEVIEFCFRDPRIEVLDVEILKPEIIPNTEYVGVGAYITREEFNNKTF